MVVETKVRSLVKAISWRCFATLTTLIICYWVTGNIIYASTISIAEFLAKMLFFYAHERIWFRVKFGKNTR